MKRLLLLIISLVAVDISAQKSALSGTWILDKITQLDGNIIEIDDPNFSSYAEYQFIGDKMLINNLEIPSTISDKQIVTPALEINFEFKDDYLVLKSSKNNRISYLLTPENYLKLYPEFIAKEVDVEGRKLYIPNLVDRPDFNYKGGFFSYLQNAFKDFENYPKAKNEFEAQFILNTNNQIEDIKILKSISTKFDKLALEAISTSPKYFKNNSGKNYLYRQTFTFNFEDNYQKHNKGKSAKKMEEKAREFYQNNDFENAVKQYENLKTYNDVGLDRGVYRSSLIKLGISYLALSRNDEACKNFKLVGDLHDFSVRNYLIHFCSK